jgi:transcriptional regulator with XRE-family HTH domain
MNRKRFASYLRTYRRRWGLSQTELAFLLGFRSGSVVSRLESEKTTVSLGVAFGCFILFGTQPAELFPGLCGGVERIVMARVRELYESVQGNPSRATKFKIELLEDALAREEKRRARRNSP